MSGFQGLVRDFIGADNTSLVLVAADGTESTNSGGDARSNALRLKREAQGLHADADGTIALVSPDGTIRAFTVKAGAYYPYRFVQVRSTGTSLTPDQIGLLFMPY